MTLIQIISDVHLEAPKTYDIYKIPAKAPYLALLGDVGCVKDDDYINFLTEQLRQFKIVFLLLGNHEPYHSDWGLAKEKLRRYESEMRANADSALGTFIFLDQTRYDLSPGLTILGCILFSRILPERIEEVSFGLNDFYHIDEGKWTVEMHNEAHEADLKWLNEQVEEIERNEPSREVLIFTHHSPTTVDAATDPQHRNSKIASGFATDLSQEFCWTSRSVKLWAFGHTHFNCNFKCETTGKLVVTNQRGYYFSQAAGFDAEKVVEV